MSATGRDGPVGYARSIDTSITWSAVSPPSVTVFSWARTHISQPLIALSAPEKGRERGACGRLGRG